MTAHSLQPDVAEISETISPYDDAATAGVEPRDDLAGWQDAVDEFSANFHAEVNQILTLLDEWKLSAADALPAAPCVTPSVPPPIDAPTVAAAAETADVRPIAPSIESSTDRLAALKARLSRQMNSTGRLVPESAAAATNAGGLEAPPT